MTSQVAFVTTSDQEPSLAPCSGIALDVLVDLTRPRLIIHCPASFGYRSVVGLLRVVLDPAKWALRDLLLSDVV